MSIATVENSSSVFGLQRDPNETPPKNQTIYDHRKYEIMRLNLRANELKTESERTAQKAIAFVLIGIMFIVFSPASPIIFLVALPIVVFGVGLSIKAASMENRAKEMFRTAMIYQGIPLHEALLN